MGLRVVLLIAMTIPLAAEDIGKVSFLAGCWEGPDGEEHWMKPRGGTMLGIFRDARNPKNVFTEFMLIREEQGTLVLNVQLRMASTSTAFRLKKLAKEEVVFENPQHDYPQRIMYKIGDDGQLHARIEGTDKGKVRAFDFPMSAIPCR